MKKEKKLTIKDIVRQTFPYDRSFSTEVKEGNRIETYTNIVKELIKIAKEENVKSIVIGARYIPILRFAGKLFVSAPLVSINGSYKVGVLNKKYTIICSPFISSDVCVIGSKIVQLLDKGPTFEEQAEAQAKEELDRMYSFPVLEAVGLKPDKK